MWRGEASRGMISALVACTLVLASCTASPTDETTSDAPSTSTTIPDETTSSSPVIRPATPCDIPGGVPFLETATVELAELGRVDGVRVMGAVYPHPDYEGRPWSQWGQGIVTEDGRFFSAIGDHRSEDGNSYLFEYEPVENRLTLIGDVLSYVDHVPGTWGYGKVHSQMVPGPCGEIYFST